MKKLVQISIFLISILFVTNCSKKDDESPEEKQFGIKGTHEISKFTVANDIYTSVYYPSDIATMSSKTPVVFFISGWTNSGLASKYESLLSFIASHGYTVIFTNQGAVMNAQYAIDHINQFLDNQENDFVNNIKPYLDTSKIGIIGHSAGGGATLTALKYYTHSDANYGSNGSFVMQLDPWFAFDMTANDIKSLPENTNLIIIRFGEGGNNLADGTDARIPLTLYSFLTSIPDKNKDYQIYDKDSADHSYPYGNKPYNQMQGILKPLDALMDYTFGDQIETARVVALENGSDHPYEDGLQIVLENYEYPCNGSSTLIDYCVIVP